MFCIVLVSFGVCILTDSFLVVLHRATTPRVPREARAPRVDTERVEAARAVGPRVPREDMARAAVRVAVRAADAEVVTVGIPKLNAGELLRILPQSATFWKKCPN